MSDTVIGILILVTIVVVHLINYAIFRLRGGRNYSGRASTSGDGGSGSGGGNDHDGDSGGDGGGGDGGGGD